MFKDVFTAHQGLLHINEKLRQQTLEQDKVRLLCVRSQCGGVARLYGVVRYIARSRFLVQGHTFYCGRIFPCLIEFSALYRFECPGFQFLVPTFHRRSIPAVASDGFRLCTFTQKVGGIRAD